MQPKLRSSRRWLPARLRRRLVGARLWAGLRLSTQVVLLAVGVAILAGGAVGVALVQNAQAALRDDALRHGQATADLAAEVTANYMVGIWAPARGLVVQSSFRQAAVAHNLASLTPALTYWLAQNPRAADAALYDLNGLNQASGQADQSIVGVANVWNRPWFQAALATGVPQQGGATISRTTGRPAAPYHVPILDDQGHVRAVLSAVVSLAALSDTLRQVDLGTGAAISLVDLEQGIYLANADPTRILQPLEQLGEVNRRVSDGQRGSLETAGPSGPVLAAFAPVGGLHWAVLVEQPSAVAFAPAYAMAQRGTVLILLAVVLAATIGMAVAGRINHSLRQLRLATEGVARGELDRRVNITQKGELGELGRAFDEMAAQLQAAMALLRVSEEQSRRESERLLALHAASSALSAHTAEPTAVLDQILQSAVTLLGAGSGSVYRWDAEAGLLRCVRNWGVPTADITPDLRRHEGLAGHTFGISAPVICNDYGASQFATPSGRAGGMRAGLGVPLLWGGSAIGVLLIRVYADETMDLDPAPRFDEDDARLTALFGDQASAAMFTAEAFEQQRFEALHDSLTGLPNRVMLHDRIEQAIAAADTGSAQAALLLLDLDRFKEVNDTLGHASGDLLLREAGRRLATAIRTSDLAARVGGDEFSVLLWDTTPPGVERVATYLASLFDQPFVLEGKTVRVGVSIGAALVPDHGRSVDVLLRCADLAMYAAKRTGGGLAIYSTALGRIAA